MSTEAERAALIARQGPGARYDAAEAPSEALMLARRGTAYFARVLNGLSDADVMEPAHAKVVAGIGYHGRGLAEHLAALRQQAPAPEARQARDAISLPARALRGLFQHSAIHLDVEWRDLPGRMWSVEVPGLDMRAAQTPLARAEAVWRASLHLGGRRRDLPPEFR
jgi:maleylpyruvate isomerase